MRPSDRISHIRDHAKCHRHRDLDIELRELEAELLQLEAIVRAFVPAHVTVTTLEDSVSNTYPLGSSPRLAAAVANAEGVPLPGTPVSWTASAGTLVTDPSNPDVRLLTNAPLGDVTVTATTDNGVSGSDTITIVDNTPASVTVTDSAS
ncbi:MAG TPA: hypothetical protein VFA96_02290 [Nocardioides sp.]|nr:hypothetical protein [Nocardioides sp.]